MSLTDEGLGFLVPGPNGGPPLDDDLDPPPPDDLDISWLKFLRFDQLTEEEPIKADILRREDGLGLFYRSAVNSIAGDPGIGKTFAALLAAVATLTAGGNVLLADWEDTPGRLRTRFDALGVAGAMLERVWAIDNPTSFEPYHIRQLIDFVRDTPIDVVIIDSVTPSIEAHDLAENDGGDYSRWHRYLPLPLARAGACVILIDHRPKPPSGQKVTPRNLWSVGSRHKLAAIDGVAYILEARDAFARSEPGRTGRLDLVIAKDRHGGIGARGDIVARIELTPTTEAAITHKIATPPATADRDPETGEHRTSLDRLLGRRDEVLTLIWRLWQEETQTAPDTVGLNTRRITDYLRAMRALELDGPPLRFRDQDLRAALWAWRDRGHLAHEPGKRGADLWRPVQAMAPRPPLPFDDADLPDPEDPDLNF